MIEDMYSMAESQGADIVLCDFRMIYTDKIVNYYTVDWSDDKLVHFKITFVILGM